MMMTCKARSLFVPKSRRSIGFRMRAYTFVDGEDYIGGVKGSGTPQVGVKCQVSFLRELYKSCYSKGILSCTRISSLINATCDEMLHILAFKVAIAMVVSNGNFVAFLSLYITCDFSYRWKTCVERSYGQVLLSISLKKNSPSFRRKTFEMRMVHAFCGNQQHFKHRSICLWELALIHLELVVNTFTVDHSLSYSEHYFLVSNVNATVTTRLKNSI